MRTLRQAGQSSGAFPLRTTLVLTLTLALAPVSRTVLLAGEAIDFSGAKAKVDSSLENRLSTEKASRDRRGLSVDGSRMLDETARQGQITTTRNRKEENRKKKEEIEKKSWILLDRGQLQDADKSGGDFGVRDESMETEKTAADIWFSRRDDRSPKAPHQPSSGPQAPSDRAVPAARPETDEKTEPRAKETEVQITHTAREVDLRTPIAELGARDLLSPRASGGVDAAGSDHDRGRRLDIGLRLGDTEPGRSTLGKELGWGLGPGSGRDSSLLAKPNSPGSLSGVPGSSTLNGLGSRLGDSSPGSGFNSSPFVSPFSSGSGLNNNNLQQRNAFSVESSRSGR